MKELLFETSFSGCGSLASVDLKSWRRVEDFFRVLGI